MSASPEPFSQKLSQRMVNRVQPDWQVHETSTLTGGHHPVAEVVIDTAEARRRFVLKATAADGAPLAATEVRVLRFLENESSLPVPVVIGAVDEQADLPTPFFLMEPLPGTKHPRTELGTLDEATLSALARSAGRHVAELQGIARFERFGRITHQQGDTLDGGRPAGTPDELVLDEPFEAWHAAISRWGERALEALDGGRFADLVADLRGVLEARIADLQPPREPVLAHIDWSLDNVLADPASNTITGLPDWEFTVAASPGYDIVYATHSLAGGPWRWVPSYPDRCGTIREQLLDGYRASTPPGRLREYRANRPTYTLLNTLHAMVHTVDRLELDGASADQIGGAVDRLRETASRIADG